LLVIGRFGSVEFGGLAGRVGAAGIQRLGGSGWAGSMLVFPTWATPERRASASRSVTCPSERFWPQVSVRFYRPGAGYCGAALRRLLGSGVGLPEGIFEQVELTCADAVTSGHFAPA
jgi:hypothetical protein